MITVVIAVPVLLCHTLLVRSAGVTALPIVPLLAWKIALGLTTAIPATLLAVKLALAD